LSRFDSPAQAAYADEGTPAKVTVKWFNSTKGFGFVAPEDGQGDAFLHGSVLNRAGLQHIGEGAELDCMVAPGAKGRQVVRIVQIISEGSNSYGGGYSSGFGGGGNSGGFSSGFGNSGNGYSSSFGGRPAHQAPSGPELEVSGTVKWFKPEKGFGFIAADDGDKDIFVHKSLLRSANLPDLESGQRVKVRAVTASKGREATWIGLA
jgi:cold shock protein